MTVSLKGSTSKRPPPEGFNSIVQAVVAAVPLLLSAEPTSVATAVSTAGPMVVNAVFSVFKPRQDDLREVAWAIVRASYASAIAKFVATASIKRRPFGAELETLVAALLNRAEILVNQEIQTLPTDFFFSPLKVPVLRDAAIQVTHEFSSYSQVSIEELRRAFEECLSYGLSEVRATKNAEFAIVEAALAGPLSSAIERRRAVARHHDYIIRAFTQKPVFGQEDTGITLAQIYVKQRALWNTRRQAHEGEIIDVEHEFFDSEQKRNSKWCYDLHTGDLHKLILGWLNNANTDDAIRVVAGGPGSGKSTFAKALALDVIDANKFDLLFVPLQEIEPTGTFENRIEGLFKNRSELGFDRVETPLSWLGKTDIEGNPPTKPLLIICDGLDEIAPPGSIEAANVTSDFIQTLSTWICNRNSAGLLVCAMILGRTISAQEAFRKLAIHHHALIRVGGLLPLETTMEWRIAKERKRSHDPEHLSEKDQRKDFWSNWCRANSLSDATLPTALEKDSAAAHALLELTAEPLLLYLLLWTGYLGERWEVAAENRNFVYEEIFRHIYVRQWGGNNSAGSNLERGGHAGTVDLAEDDFFALQEALGLASWSSGGRTVSSDAFSEILQMYLDPDAFQDLASSIGSSLRSVALQSYTRTVGAENAGYEFVHKTLGEYLIARGLVRWIKVSLSHLAERVNPGRLNATALKVCQLVWQGPFTVEIHRFFHDEFRKSFSADGARAVIENQLSELVSWILKNGCPIHKLDHWTVHTQHASLQSAEFRSLDVIWAAMQSLAELAYHPNVIANTGSSQAGAIKVQWPTAFSFNDLLRKLSSFSLVHETKRIASFDFIDFSGQALTDQSYGSVIYSYGEDHAPFQPLRWLYISFRYSSFDNAKFYSSHLNEADFTGANLSGSTFGRASLNNASFLNANLTDASFHGVQASHTRFTNAKLDNADLIGCQFNQCDFRDASMRTAKFIDRGELRYALDPVTKFWKCDLKRSAFDGSDLGNTVFGYCDVVGATFAEAVLEDIFVQSTDFHNAILDNQNSEVTGKQNLFDGEAVVVSRSTKQEKPPYKLVILNITPPS